jgi:CheY-like chemotaxis protein
VLRVLVVDDEPDLCLLLQKYLCRQGYEVDIAGSGEEAWEAVERHPGRFGTFLIDLALPGMTGAELARKLLDAQPSAKILLSSGYVFDPSRIDADSGRVAFLRKPFMPKQLAEALRELAGNEEG